MVEVRWADVCLISLIREMLGGWGGVLMLILWCGGGWCGLGRRQWAVEVIWTCTIISCTPSDPIFPKVPSHYFLYPFWSLISQSALLNTYTLMVLCWGRCSLLSMGWVSLSSKEMPLTCLAGCWMWLGARPTGLSLIWGLGGGQHLWAPVPIHR